MKRLRHKLIVMGIVVLLSACEPRNSQSTATLDVPESPTPTMMPSPSQTLTPTVTATSTQAIPTPTFPAIEASNLRLFDFIFGDSTSECALPCWKGLVAGKSDREDVQQMFDTVFGFNGTVDFFDSSLIERGDRLLGIHELDTTVYLSSIPNMDLNLYVTLSPATDTVTGIVFQWGVDSRTLKADVTPERIMKKLGPPSKIYAQYLKVPVEGMDEMRFLMIYEEGIAFYATTYALEIDIPPYTIKFCVDDRFSSNSTYAGDIYLSPAFPEREVDFTVFQQGTVLRNRSNHSLAPIEQIFGITTEQFADAVLNGQQKCFIAK